MATWASARKLLQVPVLVICALGLSFPEAATAASGRSPGPSGHYYETARWYGAAENEGAYADLYVSKGSVADTSNHGFIEQALWEATDNSTNTYTCWVEAGYSYGWQSVTSYTSSLVFYFARERPDSSGSCIDYAQFRVISMTPSVGTYMPIEIRYPGDDDWDVYFDFQVQKSDDNGGPTIVHENPPYSYAIETGLEATFDGSVLSGAYSAGLDYEHLNGDWNGQWGTGTSLRNADPAGGVSWVTTDSKVKDWQN